VLEFAAQDLFPVRAPFDLFHALAGQQRARPCRGHGFRVAGLLQVRVVEVEGLVIVINGRHVRVGEDVRQYPPAPADARLDFAIVQALPAALPAFLVFPLLG